MTNSNQKELAGDLNRIKARILEERSTITDLTELLRRPVEREAGIWEYGFEELEAEMWRRLSQLEEHQDCTSEDQTLPSGRASSAVVRRLKNLYRTVTGPLSRAIIDRRKQFNLDQQNLLNKESIPLYLAVLLTLQRLKDRLNILEDRVEKLRENQEETYREIQRLERPHTREPERGA